MKYLAFIVCLLIGIGAYEVFRPVNEFVVMPRAPEIAPKKAVIFRQTGKPKVSKNNFSWR